VVGRLADAASPKAEIPKLPEQEASAMAGVWVRMKSIYGHLWSSNFKDESQVTLAQRDWLSAFRRKGYTTGDIGRALDYCADHVPDMPNLPAFLEIVKVCRMTGQRQREADSGMLYLPETTEQAEQRKAREATERQRYATVGLDRLKSIKAIFD